MPILLIFCAALMRFALTIAFRSLGPEIVNHPLSRRELVERVPLGRRLAAPVFGGVALAVVGVMAMVIPLPTQETKAPTDSIEAPSPDPVSDPSQADPSR